MDGKHIRTECSKHCRRLTIFINNYSFVLLAVWDPNYCLMLYDFGQYGSRNDAVALANSKLGKVLDENKLYVPESWGLD